MHILKWNNTSCFSWSRVKDTYLFPQAKPPPSRLSFKKPSSSSFTKSHHRSHVSHRRRVMLGRGRGGDAATGESSGNISLQEYQRQLLTQAMFSSLLKYINDRQAPNDQLTMEQLVSNLWALPPAHRRQYTKTLMILLVKKKVDQQRRAAAAAATTATATAVAPPTAPATERTSPGYQSSSGNRTCTVPSTRCPPSVTCGSPVPCPCKSLPLNKRSLRCHKNSKHSPTTPTDGAAVPRLPFSENSQLSASEQVLPSARNRLSSGCDGDTLDSSSSSAGFSSSDRSSSGDGSIFRYPRWTTEHIEAAVAMQSTSASSNVSFRSPQSLTAGRGEKRSISPQPGCNESLVSRTRRRVLSPHPKSNQPTSLSSLQERAFSPEPVFGSSQLLREEPTRHFCKLESSGSKAIPRPLNAPSPRASTPTDEVAYRVRLPNRHPRLHSATPSPPLSASKQHRRSWGNPLKRIFVQAPDTNGAAGGGATAPDQTTPTGASTPAAENGSSTNSRVVPSGDSSSGGGNVADSTSGGGAVSTSSNPFARVAPPSASWTAGSSTSSNSSSGTATDTTHHRPPSRPVLAPPKLGGFGNSLSSQQAFPSRPAGGGILAPSSLFSGATSKAAQSTDPPSSHTKFTLKPSILGSAVSTNPFSKAPAVDFELDNKDNEAQPKKAAGADSSSGAVLSTSAKAASSDAVDSSSEAKPSAAASATNAAVKEASKKSSDSPSGASQSPETSSSFTAATPPPSPPPASMRRQDAMGSSASSSAAAGKTSVFGVFSQAVAAQENTPAASSSPKPPALSSNGVKSPLPSGSSAAAPSFIFGQNLQSRVVGSASDDAEGSEAAAAAAAPTPALDASEDNFFTAAASTLATSSASGSTRTQNGGPAKSLETSSRELAEKESREKRKFEEVQVITGEETESNVLQMNCKVYRWVKGSWQERGRGILRLNDWGSGGTELHSRLVVRTQGTLTIMLNTNIWSEMAVERASNKSVRFTASDPDGTPNIYLVMGLPKDIDLLYTSLEWRVSNSRRREQKESNKRARPDDQSTSSTSLN